MEYTVVIRKEHCIGSKYLDCNDCALARAIKEQIPILKIKSVAGTFINVFTKTGVDKYNFDFGWDTGWHGHRMSEILSGDIKYHRVTISSLNHLKELSEANVIAVKEIVNAISEEINI